MPLFHPRILEAHQKWYKRFELIDLVPDLNGHRLDGFYISEDFYQSHHHLIHMSNNRGAKILGLALTHACDKKSHQTLPNINNLVPNVTYDFEVSEEPLLEYDDILQESVGISDNTDYVSLPEEEQSLLEVQETILKELLCSNTNPTHDIPELDIRNDPDYMPLSESEEDDNIEKISPEQGSKRFSDVENIRPKNRRKVANRKEWDKYVNQEKRMKGQEYIGYRRKNAAVRHDIKRRQR
nr:unnamed protein product [Callosobruchus analis]